MRSAGVDWITATARDSSRNSPLALQGKAAIAIERTRGNLERPWRWKGYEGLTCGSASLARRHDGTIVRLSSGLASDRWRYILPDCDNVSRLDLQVTMHDSDQSASHAAVAYEETKLARAAVKRPWGATLIVGTPTGQTCYIGSRSSDRYGRIYDKYAETQEVEYLNTWRYETEYKGAPAATLGRSLGESADVSQDVTALVVAFFIRRGVTVPFLGCSLLGEPLSHYRRSDHERTLEWLRMQVAPAVARLRRAGLGSRTLIALGLSTLLDSDADADNTPVWRRLRDA